MIVCAHCLWATPYLTLPEASTESTLDSDSDSDSDRDKRSEKTPVQTKAESSSSSSGMLHLVTFSFASLIFSQTHLKMSMSQVQSQVGWRCLHITR